MHSLSLSIYISIINGWLHTVFLYILIGWLHTGMTVLIEVLRKIRTILKVGRNSILANMCTASILGQNQCTPIGMQVSYSQDHGVRNTDCTPQYLRRIFVLPRLA